MHAIDTTVAILAGLALAMVLFASWIRLHWINEPLLALLLGVLVGPEVLGWFDLAAYGEEPKILEVVARYTLALALVVVGLELRGYLGRHWRSLVALVAGGTVLMWGASSVVVRLILGLEPLEAILIGAVLAPIDPILTATVATGRIARENLPERVRHLLSAESAARHGLGLVVVLQPAFLLTKPDAEAWRHWLVHALLWKGLVAVVVGVIVGSAVGRAQAWSAARGFAETETGPLVALFLALSLAVGSLVERMGSDGVLAVLAAGIAFAWTRTGEAKAEALKRQERLYEHLLKLVLQVPVFFLLGTALPWAEWKVLGWKAPALVMTVLLLRRIPAVLLLKPLVGDIRTGAETLFVGWFGPMGIGALFFAAVAHEETGNPEVWPVATLLIAASVVAHDLTATPLSQWLARHREALATDPPRA
ncbi:MAG: cation:proton antiporter [Chloroflexota bacterium]|nr:cation:proton antiporter [Chloroflexota bacterium]